MDCPAFPRSRDPLTALRLVLRSVEAIGDVRALSVLLGTFAMTGLLLAMAETALARQPAWWGGALAAAALFVAFYGGNAAGILVMDAARDRPVREIVEALRSSLLSAHRLLLALLILLAGYAAAAALLLGLLWLCRADVLGTVAGPLLFGLVVPLGVLAVGLAAPGVWAGAGVMEVVRDLVGLVRHRLLAVALLMALVSLLTAGVGALASFVVLVGGRVIAALGVAVVGVDVPARELMGGLFGYGLRSFGAAGAPLGSTAHTGAALVGGGVVFALALVLPGLVYLRGTCAVYLAMCEAGRGP